MKKVFLVFAVVMIAVLTLASFKTELSAPTIYPGLEAYFKAIDATQFNKEHLTSLEHIKDYIRSSDMDHEDWNLIFYCSENTFRSQAAQVFAQTLCGVNKHRRVKAYSAGLVSGEINPALINYFSRIGYKVTKTEKEGKAVYELKFSDKANPIVLFSKTTTDPSLPKSTISSVIVCDINNEANCASLKTETNPVNLPFEKITDTDSIEKIEKAAKRIAAEMLYVTKK